MDWQGHVVSGIFALGVVGLVYLLVGIVACALSAIPRRYA